MTESERLLEDDQRLLEVRVATADGVETDHMYPLRHVSEAQEVADVIQQRVENALAGRTPFLALQSPAVMYNPDHLVRVTFVVITREDLFEVFEEAEGRGPIGFRPS